MTKTSNGTIPIQESTTAVRPEALAVLNILLRDATAMRQRLFSYLQFYLTVQSGLAVFFGFLTHESLEAPKDLLVTSLVVLSTLGLLTSLAVLSYGVFMLRPGDDSRIWIASALERTDRLDDVAAWSFTCHRRLEWLVSANAALDKHIARIRKGILTQLCFAVLIFVLTIRL